MIKAKLTIEAPELAKDAEDAKALWDLLAEERRLPQIIDYVSCPGGPYWIKTWWGMLPNGGVFFLSEVAKTETGLEGRIALYPQSGAEFPLGIFGWIISDLLLGQAMGEIEKVPGDTWGYRFDLWGIDAVIIIENIVESEDIHEIKPQAPD